MDDRRYPHFLCIGAKKSATSWLRLVLNQHPDIWTAPKEVHYFDDESINSILIRYLKHRNKDRIARQLIRYAMLSISSKKNWNILMYYFHLICFERNDLYYLSIFSGKSNKVCGDITPDYAIIDDIKIQRIKDLLPYIKLIYLLRNPIHRTWSHIAMHLSRKGRPGIQGVEDNVIKKLLDTDYMFKHSRYPENLKKWEKHFNKEQLFVGFHDQIRNNPEELMKDICSFLNIEFNPYLLTKMNKKINSRQYPDIPEHYAKYLANKFYDDLVNLNKKFDNQYTQNWLNYAEKLTN